MESVTLAGILGVLLAIAAPGLVTGLYWICIVILVLLAFGWALYWICHAVLYLYNRFDKWASAQSERAQAMIGYAIGLLPILILGLYAFIYRQMNKITESKLVDNSPSHIVVAKGATMTDCLDLGE